MKKDVFITIMGMQQGSGEETLTTAVPAIYHLANGKHYIQYDELLEGGNEVVKSMLKISTSEVILSKRGMQQSQMEFRVKELTHTLYQTPYGSLNLEINTKSIQLKEENSKLEVKLDYSLSVDASKLSDNLLLITIEAVK